MSPKKLPSGARRRGAALLLALLLPALAVRADDRVRVIPRISVSEEYTTNAIQREDERSDFVTRIVPGVRLESAGERGHTRLDLDLPTYVYRDLGELDSVDRRARLAVDRRLTPRLSFFTDGDFYDLDSTDPVEDRGIEIRDSDLERREFSVAGGLRYAFTPRTSGSVTIGAFQRDTDTDLLRDLDPFSIDTRDELTATDYEGMLAALGWRHVLSARDELGLSLSAQTIEYSTSPVFSEFEIGDFDFGDQFISSSTTNTIVQTQASWTRSWSPRWSSNFAVGLRRLMGDGGELVTVTRLIDGSTLRSASKGDSDTSYAFTGSALLRREFARGHMELGFLQETRPTSGAVASQDVRSFSWTLRQRLASRWTLDLLGRWSSFESAEGSSDARGDLDSDLWFARAQLDWRLRRRLTTFLAYEYLNQSANGPGVRDYSDHRIRFGFHYSYEIDVP